MRRAFAALAILSACTAPPPAAPGSSLSPVFAPIASALPEVSMVPGEPPPLPSGATVAGTSAPVPSPPPPSTPTPTPDPAIWRFEGRVVDADGNGVAEVCVVIGPRGCQRFSPHTDERGVYFFDVPRIPTVVYDLYFMKDGYTIVWYRVQPAEPTIFNVVLQKSG